MKNTILKTTVCIAFVAVGTSVFAGDHHHGGPDHHHGNSGVRLATDIVNLVGSSLNLLRGPSVTVYSEPRVVETTTVYTAPAATTTTVYTTTAPVTTVYTTPAVYCPPPRPHFRPVPPPPPPHHPGHGGHHGPGPRR